MDASAAPAALSFSRAAVPREQRGAGAAGHSPAAPVKPEGCAWTKEKALPEQGQCYPHHKDIGLQPNAGVRAVAARYSFQVSPMAG